MTFGAKIIGMLVSNDALDDTDESLGAPGTVYPTGQGARGFEGNQEDFNIVEMEACGGLIEDEKPGPSIAFL